LLPEPKVLFAQLMANAGTEAGARPQFQALVTDLIAVRHPTANEVAGPGGTDWGMDTYVGKLDDVVAVWQSKFFLDWSGDDQRKQVRDSFNQVIAKAKEHGFSVNSWTLCVPCILPPGEQAWFDRWARQQCSKGAVQSVTIWNGTTLRRYLMQPDAKHVYDSYFQQTVLPAIEALAIFSDPSIFEGALFVRQLREAGRLENDAARGLFFAAEALVRDIAARGDEIAISAIDELHLEIHSIWESRFNAAIGDADANGQMSGLVEQVMDGAAACADPYGVHLRAAHRKGVAHRLVENARAGWVSHWRQVAASHSNESAGEIAARHLATAAPQPTGAEAEAETEAVR
jgi:hypothetical protein